MAKKVFNERNFTWKAFQIDSSTMEFDLLNWWHFLFPFFFYRVVQILDHEVAMIKVKEFSSHIFVHCGHIIIFHFPHIVFFPSAYSFLFDPTINHFSHLSTVTHSHSDEEEKKREEFPSLDTIRHVKNVFPLNIIFSLAIRNKCTIELY